MTKLDKRSHIFIIKDREEFLRSFVLTAVYFTEETRVKAWKLLKDNYKTKGTYADTQLKVLRPRRHGNLEKRQLIATFHNCWR